MRLAKARKARQAAKRTETQPCPQSSSPSAPALAALPRTLVRGRSGVAIHHLAAPPTREPHQIVFVHGCRAADPNGPPEERNPTPRPRSSPTPATASMEPLPEERNHPGVARGHGSAGHASMEPLPEERNHGDSAVGFVAYLRASMEPLPEERNHVASRHASVRPNMPQWSRSLRSGITVATLLAWPYRPCASMEPLPEERNHVGAHRHAGDGEPASMEPLPEERNHPPTPAHQRSPPRSLNGAAP